MFKYKTAIGGVGKDWNISSAMQYDEYFTNTFDSSFILFRVMTRKDNLTKKKKYICY